jgi:large subunit ribosomal protein L1
LILDIKEIDMKAPEGKITEVVELPHATAKPNKICFIASGELALKARRANADNVIERADLDALAAKRRICARSLRTMTCLFLKPR